MNAARQELAFLVQALRSHAEWVRESGADGLIACDSTWLASRRQQYRNYEGPSFDDVEISQADSEVADSSGEQAPSQDELDAALSARDATSAAVGVELGMPPGTDAPAPPPALEPSLAPDAVTPTKKRSRGSELAGDAALAALHAAEAALKVGKTDGTKRPTTVVSDLATKAPAPHVSTEPAVPGTWQEHLPSLVFSDDVLKRLDILRDEVKTCTNCGLHSTRNKTVFARGSGRSGICFIGEGPGADEDAQGLPFVGAAGQLLDKMIEAMGFDRDDVYVCNIVKCRPPDNRKPQPEEMSSCRPYVATQLELLQPRVIVALGATAVQGLLGLSLGITRLRGQWRLYKGHTPVMPTFHPAYLLRKPSAKREVWQDLQQVLAQLEVPVPGKH